MKFLQRQPLDRPAPLAAWLKESPGCARRQATIISRMTLLSSTTRTSVTRPPESHSGNRQFTSGPSDLHESADPGWVSDRLGEPLIAKDGTQGHCA